MTFIDLKAIRDRSDGTATRPPIDYCWNLLAEAERDRVQLLALVDRLVAQVEQLTEDAHVAEGEALK